MDIIIPKYIHDVTKSKQLCTANYIVNAVNVDRPLITVGHINDVHSVMSFSICAAYNMHV